MSSTDSSPVQAPADPGTARPLLHPWVPPLLVLLVVVLGYFIEPARLPLVGEESWPARHGIEMAEAGTGSCRRSRGSRSSIARRCSTGRWRSSGSGSTSSTR
ncbi:MAG: hypothetical protein R3F30_14210 [Planctomycetota bacterium]